jgi:serine/threonine protein kinase
MSESNQREQHLFSEALLVPPGERARFLDEACGTDAALRGRIDALLRAHDAAGDFMDTPASPGAAESKSAGAAASPREEVSGLRIGRYKLQQKIGEGGCGVVWMAEQEEPVRRTVALKIIKLGMDTSEVVARFEAERQALAMLDHPNIAKILDAGATDTGRPFFVMELVRGIKITDFCDRYNLSTAQRLELFSQVCHAVQHAHQKGIIHRDLKPSNVLVTLNDGVPVAKVIDFGIAKATTGRLTDRTLFTAFEQFIGTPSYMSPEQAELSGIDIDTRSDVYSLGVLLYELLSGRLPFDPKSLLRAGLDEIRRIIREVDPPKPSTNLLTLADSDRDQVARQRSTDAQRLSLLLRGDLDWIVMRCLEKNRGRRYETPDALAADIARHLRNEPVVARPASRVYRLNRLIRRNRLVFAAAAAVVLALLAGLVISTWQAVRATRAERQANLERATAVNERTRAEDLLKFLLGDLYTQLDKVGKLELLDAVADKANEYFASLQPGDLDDTTQFSRARALRLLAAVRMSQGRTLEATKAIAEAYARGADLTARNPRDGEALFERAQAEYFTGAIYCQKADFPSATYWWTRYKDTATALVALDPTRVAWQLELSDGHINLASLDKERGNWATAQSEFIAALATLSGMKGGGESNPEIQSREALAQEQLGDLADLQGSYAEAQKHYSIQAEDLENLVRADPKVAENRHDLAVAYFSIMTTDMERGEYAAARQQLGKAEMLIGALMAVDPQDLTLKELSLLGLLAEVALDRQRDDYDSARKLVERALPQLNSLASQAPDRRTCLWLLARAWRQEADLQSASDDPLAVESARRSVGFGEKLTASGGASDQELGECAKDHISAGEIWAKAGDAAAARGEWLRATELLEPRMQGTRNWRLLEPGARAATHLGRFADAGALIERLNLLGYVPIEPWPNLGPRVPSKTTKAKQ